MKTDPPLAATQPTPTSLAMILRPAPAVYFGQWLMTLALCYPLAALFVWRNPMGLSANLRAVACYGLVLWISSATWLSACAMAFAHFRSGLTQKQKQLCLGLHYLAMCLAMIFMLMLNQRLYGRLTWELNLSFGVLLIIPCVLIVPKDFICSLCRDFCHKIQALRPVYGNLATLGLSLLLLFILLQLQSQANHFQNFGARLSIPYIVLCVLFFGFGQLLLKRHPQTKLRHLYQCISLSCIMALGLNSLPYMDYGHQLAPANLWFFVTMGLLVLNASLTPEQSVRGLLLCLGLLLCSAHLELFLLKNALTNVEFVNLLSVFVSPLLGAMVLWLLYRPTCSQYVYVRQCLASLVAIFLVYSLCEPTFKQSTWLAAAIGTSQATHPLILAHIATVWGQFNSWFWTLLPAIIVLQRNRHWPFSIYRIAEVFLWLALGLAWFADLFLLMSLSLWLYCSRYQQAQAAGLFAVILIIALLNHHIDLGLLHSAPVSTSYALSLACLLTLHQLSQPQPTSTPHQPQRTATPVTHYGWQRHCIWLVLGLATFISLWHGLSH
ncbi:hypothetical protein [Brackiella oedipodis]|uniref:hypothetical protein n=1 Tax=Brackiella oedipodis TaxID=124225 RepID=UPI00048ED84A|nr:hypothetical protein [Brackiella oedipodis]